MKALLAKNKKKLDDKKTVKTELPKDQQPKEEETQVSNIKENAPIDNDSDSAESESDIIAQRANDAKFKEAKEEGNKDNSKKELGEVLQDKNTTQEVKAEKKVFGQGPMNFSRPKFSNKKPGKFADGEFASLDQLDESPSQTKKTEPAKKAESLPEEEKKEPRKPTFKGRMNLGGTGAQNNDNNEGVTKQYDFGVVYKQPYADKDGEKKERTRGTFGDIVEGQKDGPNEERKGGYNKGKRDKGTEWGKGQKKSDDVEDGFEVVKKQERRIKKKNNDDSSDEEEGSKP